LIPMVKEENAPERSERGLELLAGLPRVDGFGKSAAAFVSALESDTEERVPAA